MFEACLHLTVVRSLFWISSRLLFAVNVTSLYRSDIWYRRFVLFAFIRLHSHVGILSHVSVLKCIIVVLLMFKKNKK